MTLTDKIAARLLGLVRNAEAYGKLRLVDAAHGQSLFIPLVRESLRALEEYDRRRHKRIIQCLDLIINTPIDSLGRFQIIGGKSACILNLNALGGSPQSCTSDTYYAYSLALGPIIAHEATHAYLERRGIFYTPDLRERIEKLCFTESLRCIRRLAARGGELPQFGEDLRFDPTEHRRRWSLSPWQRLRLASSAVIAGIRSIGSKA